MSEVNIAKNISDYRKSKEMTIKELANTIGSTPSLLSQVEKGTANPSLNTLKLISQALEVPLYKFFVNDEISEEMVVRKDHRKKISFPEADSFTYELLTPNSQGSIEFMIMKIPANEASSKELFSHKGEEVAYVTKGSVRLILENSSIDLECGDSVRIQPFAEHKWENITIEECEVIFAVTPPSF